MKKIFFFFLFLSLSFAVNIKKTDFRTVQNIKNLDIKTPDIDSKTLIVRFKTSDKNKINSAFSKMNSLKNKKYRLKFYKYISHGSTGVLYLENVDFSDLKSIRKELKKSSYVKSVSYNYVRKAQYIPNDELFDFQWFLDASGTDYRDINITSVWDVTKGDKNIVVAVFDTGESIYHKDLIDNLWVNSEELNGESGVDDDGNGYVDDIYGYDFAYDLDGNNAPLSGDIGSHGTHVSGLIGAVGDNGIGVSGVNIQVTVLPVKIFRPNLGAYDSDILEAIDYVLKLKQNGVNIVAVNASYGGFGGNADDSAMRDAISELGDNNIMFFAAAGNDGYDNDLLYYDNPALPASYNLNNIVAVAASEYNGSLAYFSQYGKKTVQVAAPGWDDLSTTDFIDGNNTGSQDYSDDFEGSLNWSGDNEWNLTQEDYRSSSHSLCDSPSEDYDDYTISSVISPSVDLSGETGKKTAFDFCMNNKLAAGDYLNLYFYDKNSDTYQKVKSFSGTDGWECIGVPIEEYYKTDSFKVKFELKPNGDGVNDDGVYIDDVKIGEFNNTDTYERYYGTSMATPLVAGTYALLCSVNDESMYYKISRIIGNGSRIISKIGGVNLNVGSAVDDEVKPLILNTKKVAYAGNELNISVIAPGDSPEVYLGNIKANIKDYGDGNISVEIPNDATGYLVVKNGGLTSSNRLYISKWKMLTDMPDGVNTHIFGNYAAYDGKLYVFNGFSSGVLNDTVDIYDIKNDSWNETSNKNQYPLSMASSVLSESKIYIFGGLDSDNNYNEYVIVYDIENDEWSEGSALPYKSTLSRAVDVGDKIYLLGGKDENSTLSSVYEYDKEKDTFIQRSSMPEALLKPAVCVFGDNIYVFGGENSDGYTDSAYVYDTVSDKWSSVSSIPDKVSGLACSNINNEFIAVFSGSGDDGLKNVMYFYYPQSDTYKNYTGSVLSNILPRANIDGNVLDYNNSIYYIAGFNPYVYETKTIEVINKNSFIINSTSTDTDNVQKPKSSSSAPAFDFITVLILLGGVLLILKYTKKQNI